MSVTWVAFARKLRLLRELVELNKPNSPLDGTYTLVREVAEMAENLGCPPPLTYKKVHEKDGQLVFFLKVAMNSPAADFWQVHRFEYRFGKQRFIDGHKKIVAMLKRWELWANYQIEQTSPETCLPVTSEPPTKAAPADLKALDGHEPQPSEQPEYVFRRDGDGWFIRAFGVEGHFKASRGFECLGRLLTQPGASIPLEYLVAKDSGAALKFSVPGQVAETVIDKEALKQYRKGLTEYDALINQALRDGREGDAEHLQTERKHLIDHIAAITGFGGKLRHNKSESKKLRDRIQKALKRTYKALRQASPPMSKLADHLEAFIQPTEDGYVYMPAPPIDWRTQF